MRVLVVANPRATAMAPRERDVMIRALGHDANLTVEETANRGHAAALACRAMRSRFDAVVAFGGDGTVNEVVNGLLTDGVHEAVPPLGVIPAGSTNVFVRAMALPTRPIEATGVILEALRTGSRRPVSMGRVDTGESSRWFVFAAGMGFDASIVAGVERYRRRGVRSTHVLYARVGVRTFFQTDRRHPRLMVDLPDGTRLDDVFFAIVANADPWTFVGDRPLRPTPLTTFDSGLGLYARRRMGTAGMVWSMMRLSAAAPRVGARGAFQFHDLDGCVVTAAAPTPVQVDGDYLGLHEKLAFSTTRSAVDVLVPAAPPESAHASPGSPALVPPAVDDAQDDRGGARRFGVRRIRNRR